MTKILPEKLGERLTLGHKIKKFFQVPKYAICNVPVTNNQHLLLFIVSHVSYGITGQYANNNLDISAVVERRNASLPTKLCVAIWVPGYTPLMPADERASMDIWPPPSVCPAALPIPPPATMASIVVQWPSWDGLLSSLRTMEIVQLLKCIMCIAWSDFPVQVLKNHLRLIHGSMILDHIRTRFLGGRLICRSDLYTSIYGRLIMKTRTKLNVWLLMNFVLLIVSQV